MATKIQEQALIEGTISDLEETIARLTEQRAEVDRRISETIARRDQWRLRLKQVTTARQPHTRLRKGEALKRINELYDRSSFNAGFTMPDIAEKTGVPWSSVRNVLQRLDNGFTIAADSQHRPTLTARSSRNVGESATDLFNHSLCAK